MNLRSIYKVVEPVLVLVEYPAARDVVIDLYDPSTSDLLVDGAAMTELSPALPGVYRYIFTVDALDALGGEETDRLFLWQARLDPEESGVDPIRGTFYRGGHVDQLEAMRAIKPAFAVEYIAEREVQVGMLSTLDTPLGHGVALRQTFSYRAGTADLASVATSIVPDE